MSSFWNFLFGAVLVIIWIIAGGFVTEANVFLTNYKDKDDYLHRAYWFTFWAAFVTWFLIGVFIILVILSVMGFAEIFGAAEEGTAAESKGASKSSSYSPQGKSWKSGISWITIGFLIFALILVGITGILAAIAASSMVQSPNFDPSVEKLQKAYNDCIIAASLCLGAGGLLIIGLITYSIVGYERKKKAEAKKKEKEKEEQLELAEIQQIKLQSTKQQLQQQAQFKQQLQLAEEQAILQKVSQQGLTTTVPATAPIQ